MDTNNNSSDKNVRNGIDTTQNKSSTSNNMEALSQFLKASAGTREGRNIPPLEKWNPEKTEDMDLVIKANGEWWHEGDLVTRESLVSLFATVLWKEVNEGKTEYFLKTPVQKLRIQVEDVPLLINDIGIVDEDGISWLEFTTTTGDVVRLDQEHPIELRSYNVEDSEPQTRPYMLVRNGLQALIGRNTFYHLTEIGQLIEQEGQTILTLNSGGQDYELSMNNSQ